MAYPKFDKPLTHLAGKVGLPSGDWRKASSHSVIRLVMRSAGRDSDRRQERWDYLSDLSTLCGIA